MESAERAANPHFNVPNARPGNRTGQSSDSSFGIVGAIIALVLAVAYAIGGIHQIDEGHVGVYWVAGALSQRTSEPGLHVDWAWPISRVESIQVTIQTDSVQKIPCGTSGGVTIMFERIEVVNRLRKEFVHDTIANYTSAYDRIWIFDKIHHEINQFCSKHSMNEVYISKFDTLDESLASAIQEGCLQFAPGIEIIAVRVTKPRIPEQLTSNFESMEAEKTKLLIATENQKVVEKQAQTDARRATIEAERAATVSKINMEKLIAEKEAQAKIAEIEDTMNANRIKTAADSAFYRAKKEAESNNVLLTPEYLQYQMILSITNNTKVYFGEKIPSLFLDMNAAGLAKTMSEQWGKP